MYGLLPLQSVPTPHRKQAQVRDVDFARIRERLALQSAVGEQNRIIKKAIEQLKTIGYLDCSIEKKGRESFVIVHSRNPKLKLPE